MVEPLLMSHIDLTIES